MLQFASVTEVPLLAVKSVQRPDDTEQIAHRFDRQRVGGVRWPRTLCVGRHASSSRARLETGWKTGRRAPIFSAGPRFLQGELFHYTDAAGLIGMMQNGGELWATDVRCMNDTDEFILGHRVIERALNDRTTHPAHTLLQRLLAHPGYVSPLVFSISFSEDRDLLSQWRAYADNGAGFSVGFAHDSLDALTFDGKPTTKTIVRVLYDRDRQEKCADRIVESSAQPPAASRRSNSRTRTTRLKLPLASIRRDAFRAVALAAVEIDANLGQRA